MRSLQNLARFFASHPLTRDAPLKAWGRFARWQIESRLRDEIVVPWVGGQKLALRRGMSGATGNLYVGLHEFADMAFVVHFLREGDLFLDIGANVGSFTVLASGVARARSFSFEPIADTARDLRRNIAVNNLASLVSVHELALGERDGEVAMTVGLGPMNTVVTGADADARMVRQTTLDALPGAADARMIKLDVEGHEENVLRGAERMLAGQNLQAIEIETVTPASEQMIVRHGFARAYYDPFRHALAREPVGLPSSNTLFVRDFAFVEQRLASAPKIEVLGRTI